MTEYEYRRHPAVSRSELWKISESPEKFRYFKDNPPVPTPALVFGQAFHKLALEPENFYDEFAIIPDIDRRTKDGKADFKKFIETNDSKTMITAQDFEKAKEMCDALYRAPFVKRLLSGKREEAFFWTDEMTGEPCKCRTDSLLETDKMNIISDLKTAAKADTDRFMRDAVSYGYDFQSAMYIDGVKAVTGKEYTFVFIVIEKEPPYSVNILQADKLFIQRGYDLFREYIGIYHDCKISGDWYGYLGKYKMINNLSLPAWLAKEIE